MRSTVRREISPSASQRLTALYGDGRNAGQTETGADGGFLLQLLPGAYDLFVRLPNLSAVSRRGVIEVPTEEFVELRLAAAALKGRVTTADGRPAQAVVLLIPATEKVPRFAHNFSTAVAAFGLADDSGLFEVATDPGVYDVVVTSFDLSPGGLYLPGIEIDGVVEHDFQLPSAENSYELSGELAIESDVRFDSVVLQFYEPRTRALKQSFYGQPGQYQVYLQPGRYIVQVALLRAGGVVERVYEMGELAVESDLTWDIVVPLHSTTVVSGGAVPSRFVLEQNHPNPFNSATTIRYDLPLSVEIELALYNLAGQKVATLGHGSRMAGTHTLHWDGRDDNGRELASAVYLYRLAAGEHVETKKLLLLR